ncbi:MAG TPA: ABC transporter permease [Xanthobacteraceae bacterium]|jgi:NitT/TauT family transport system permease protein
MPGLLEPLRRSQGAICLGLALLIAWEAVTRGLELPLNTFPPPSRVVWSLFVRVDLLAGHAFQTFGETLIGFAVSVLVGILIGWLIGTSELLFDAFYPVVVVLQVVPKEALAPLLVLWFGATTLSRMLLAFLIAFFPMVINTILGLRSVSLTMRRYAQSLAMSPWQLLRHVQLPCALASIFAGMKIAVTLAVIGVVVAEIVAGRSGLGYLLLFASSRQDMGFSLAILLVLAAWGGALYGIVLLCERRAVFWRH